MASVAVEVLIKQYEHSHGGLREALGAWFGESIDEVLDLKKLGSGHINSTWLVTTSSGEFVLQQLSSMVFSSPEKVMANLNALLAAAAQLKRFAYQLPKPLPTTKGQLLVRTGSTPLTGSWRLCAHIGGTRTIQTITATTEAQAAGRAFGDFQRMARAVAPESLEPVIHRFLELDGYWHSLKKSVARAEGEARVEASSIANGKATWKTLWQALQQRFDRYVVSDSQETSVIHGDCKVNNLLFSQEADVVVAVLDLDTLMVGPWWLDFGDLVRSAAFDSDGKFRLAYYASVADGFFSGRGGLQASELDDALRAPGHLSFMLAVRFLDDHLRHDKYFRVDKHGDNLKRAQTQFQQLCELEADECVVRMQTSLKTCLGDAPR